jgi:hypothetical protein
MTVRSVLSSFVCCFLFSCASTPSVAPLAEVDTKTVKAVVTATQESTQPETMVLEKVGFATPECVVHDTAADVYIVSNINGSPFADDGNGFLSRISPTGEVEAIKWVDGVSEGVTLNAPKGMGIANGLLYVADIDHVRMFDVASGAPKGEVKVEGATFLNDIAVGDDGTVYVSDSGFNEGFAPSGSDAVYILGADGSVTPLAKDEALGHPNGLLIRGEGLVVVTFGSGEVFTLGADGKRSDGVKSDKGSLDGIVDIGGGKVLISSWEAEALYLGPIGGPFTVVVPDLPAPADIGWDSVRNRVLVPLFKNDAVHIRSLP